MTRPRRRWSFSMRTLFVVVTAVGVLCAVFGPQLYARYRRWVNQREIVNALEQVNSALGTWPPDEPLISVPTEADWVRWNAQTNSRTLRRLNAKSVEAARRCHREPPATRADRPPD